MEELENLVRDLGKYIEHVVRSEILFKVKTDEIPLEDFIKDAEKARKRIKNLTVNLIDSYFMYLTTESKTVSDENKVNTMWIEKLTGDEITDHLVEDTRQEALPRTP